MLEALHVKVDGETEHMAASIVENLERVVFVAGDEVRSRPWVPGG